VFPSSQHVHEFFEADASLPQHALQCFGQNVFVVGYGEANRAFAHSNMRTFLPHYLKTQSPQCPDNFAAGNVARQFHAVAITGSSTKCSRIRSGRFPLSKWQATASRTFCSSSRSVFPCVVMPPCLRGASQDATNHPLSASRSTVKVISAADFRCSFPFLFIA